MPNQALREAMAQAQLSRGKLAQECAVDVKTIDRWLREDERIPHPRQRWAASRALGVEPEVIWPSLKEERRSPALREITAAYPTRSAMPSTAWTELVNAASHDLAFAGYTSYFLWLTVPNLRDVLRKKAEEGARVRFLLGDPEAEITRQREAIEAVPLSVSARIAVTLAESERLKNLPNIDVRLSDRHIALSVWIFDDQAVVSTHIAASVGHDSPTYRLKRLETGGMFSAYATHVETLWSDARPAWT
jgi:lambda repressor-like predicted transcriptional regulator